MYSKLAGAKTKANIDFICLAVCLALLQDFVLLQCFQKIKYFMSSCGTVYLIEKQIFRIGVLVAYNTLISIYLSIS